MNHRVLIVGTVVAVHILGLWAMQVGLSRRAEKPVATEKLMIDIIQIAQPHVVSAPAPLAEPEPVPTPSPPKPAAIPTVRPPPAPKPEPQPVAKPTQTPTPTPIPTAQTPVALSEPPSLATPEAAEVATAPNPTPAGAPKASPPAAATAPQVELPSKNASYLNNPQPPYPPLSKRLGETGKVVVRAYIEIDGTASKASIKTSSGYTRLDQSALQTVQEWRYVPGKKGGTPEAMWFNIPISFELN